MVLILCSHIVFAQAWDPSGNNVAPGKNKLGSLNDESVVFISNDSARMRLTNTGYFGINTTLPTTYFDVNGQIRLRYNAFNHGVLTSDANGNATWSLLNLNLSGNILSIQNQGSTVDLSTYLDNTDNQTLSLSGTSLSISNGNSVDFTNWDTDATDDFSGDYNDLANQPTLFDGDYNSLSNLPTLFDGSYSSLTGLPVFSEVAQSGDYYDLINLPELFDGNYSSLSGVPTIESLNYWQKSEDDLYYNTGNIGIGISSPQKQLHIHNSEYSDIHEDEEMPAMPTTRGSRLRSESVFLLTNRNSGNTASDGLKILSNNNNAVIYLQETGSLSLMTKNPLRFKMAANGNITIGTSQNNYFVVNESGNVGINTSEPTAAFDINGDIRIRHNASENFVLTSTEDGSGEWKELKLELNENTLSLSNHNTEVDLSSFFLWSKTGNNIYYNNGSVGIGTSTPANNAQLHIKGNSKSLLLEPILFNGDNGYVDISFANPLASNSLTWTIRSHINENEKGNSLMFWSRIGAPLLVLGNDVKVGIGTHAPEAKLDVNGTVRIQNGWRGLKIEGSGAEPHRYDFIAGDLGNDPTYKGGFGIFDETAGKYRFAISKDGNVGIGTISPQFMLDVCGIIRSKEWIVEDFNCMPDFVFKPEYKLMSLDKRKQMIFENSHMPYLLSEEEMKESGVPVFHTMQGLIQNTEEIYLYLFEMNERLKILERENQKLKEQNKELIDGINTIKNK
ncbi:MAG: hypothetical protein PHW82_11925 [Bacteroidales bacterium]|nr:hypothetical protein [Bacteroidales bacterium]